MFYSVLLSLLWNFSCPLSYRIVLLVVFEWHVSELTLSRTGVDTCLSTGHNDLKLPISYFMLLYSKLSHRPRCSVFWDTRYCFWDFKSFYHYPEGTFQNSSCQYTSLDTTIFYGYRHGTSSPCLRLTRSPIDVLPKTVRRITSRTVYPLQGFHLLPQLLIYSVVGSLNLLRQCLIKILWIRHKIWYFLDTSFVPP